MTDAEFVDAARRAMMEIGATDGDAWTDRAADDGMTAYVLLGYGCTYRGERTGMSFYIYETAPTGGWSKSDAPHCKAVVLENIRRLPKVWDLPPVTFTYSSRTQVQ